MFGRHSFAKLASIGGLGIGGGLFLNSYCTPSVFKPPVKKLILPEYPKHYINGNWVNSVSNNEFIDVIDSNTGIAFARVVSGNEADTEKAIDAASEAFKTWSRTTLEERKVYLQKILIEYMKRKQEVSDVLQQELGAPKPLAEHVQSNMLPFHFTTLLSAVDEFEWTKDLGKALVVKEPVGVVGAITPWNWPLNQIACKIAPALLAGCTVVLKPSEITPINAIIIAEAIHAAGLPKGVFNMVNGTGPNCGQILATHPKVDMVSFTGSTGVGRRLHSLGAGTIKRVRTELGGKSASVVLDDATPEQISAFAEHVLLNTGQSCNALSRMLAPRSRYEEVCNIVKDTFEACKVVEASDPTATMGCIGPLSSQAQLDRVTGYIAKGIDEGARLITGGLERPEGVSPHGFFVKPTVFADVNNNMTIAREEIFGPVICIIPYDTEEEAIEIANDTIYGLNNGVCSADQDHAMEVASRLRSGQVFVNTTSMCPTAPFGGYKQSGDGREWGTYGLEDYLQLKAINRPQPKN